MLPGISDFGKDETTTVHDARVMMAFEQKMHMNFLSIWAIQRDNEGAGSCRGQADSNTCSGIRQAPWAFDHALAPFTRFRCGTEAPIAPAVQHCCRSFEAW